MEKQDEHKKLLNGYFISLYYFSVPLAIVALLILDDLFLIKTISFNLPDDEGAILTLKVMGWLGIVFKL